MSHCFVVSESYSVSIHSIYYPYSTSNDIENNRRVFEISLKLFSEILSIDYLQYLFSTYIVAQSFKTTLATARIVRK